MSKKLHYDLNKVRQFPEKEPFVMLSRELICSAAWRSRSINCVRLIDFLLMEHMNHAGSENGNLLATYDQLVKFGIGRRLVHKAISEAERSGLIWVERGGRKGFALTHANTFTLTFLPTKRRGQNGESYFVEPTGDWKRFHKDGTEKQKSTLRR